MRGVTRTSPQLIAPTTMWEIESKSVGSVLKQGTARPGQASHVGSPRTHAPQRTQGSQRNLRGPTDRPGPRRFRAPWGWSDGQTELPADRVPLTIWDPVVVWEQPGKGALSWDSNDSDARKIQRFWFSRA